MSKPPPPVTLLAGDEFLVRKVVEDLIATHVPENIQSLNLVHLDGATSDAGTIVSHLAQVPMFPGVKLVVVLDTTLLTAKADLGDEVQRAVTYYEDGKEKDATRRMLGILGKAGWALDDLPSAKAADWRNDLGFEKRDLPKGFAKAVHAMATEAGWKVPRSDTGALEQMIEQGPPGQNALVLTCAKPDKRLRLTKLIQEHGDFATHKATQSGRSVDTLDISAVTRRILEDHGKSLDRAAETALKRAIGGEMRLLAGELEKLCLFVGDKKTITVADVQAVGVSHVREEAFWELGSSVADRDLKGALFYAADGFAHRRHPIPMVASIAAALRKAHQVRTSAERHGVRRGTRNLPDVVVDEVAAVRKGKKPHPFALLKEWERSLAWPDTESLAQGLRLCFEADLALKTSAGDPRLVLERLVMRLCGR